MANPQDPKYLATSDVVGHVEGDAYIVRRPQWPALTAASLALIAGAFAPAYGMPRPRHRKRKKYAVLPDRGPVAKKVKGSLRNTPCPKCHHKMKRCVCARGGAK